MTDERRSPQENVLPTNIDEDQSKEAVDKILLQLSGQQLALYEALAEKNVELASMYQGALIVLGDAKNPDRFALAAHGLRELMEKIPAYLDVEVKAGVETLRNKARELENQWESVSKSSLCYGNPDWSGGIDNPLRKFLRQIREFFDWFAQHYPRRRVEIAKTLDKLDPRARSVPKPLEELRVEEWERLRDFFQGVSHHKRKCSLEELKAWIDALERFLLDRLRPRTFEDLSGVAAIIKEGESND